MRPLIGILVISAVLHGPALACRGAMVMLSLLASGGCLAQSSDAQRTQEADKVNPARAAAAAARMVAEAQELERGGKGPEAVKMYMRAARQGSGAAARRLAAIYEKGIPGVARDYAEQLKWENFARLLGDDVPPSETAQMLRLQELQAARGRRELAEARRRAEEEALLRDEAKKNDPRVMPPVFRSRPGEEHFQRGEALEREGKGPQAVQRYARAAQAGNARAARRLAEIYDKGAPGVARDYATSVQWEHVARLLDGGRSSDTAHSRDALLEEAELLERMGKSTEALAIFERAARAGSGKAALRLAQIYEKGIPGVARDYDSSSKWYSAARLLGERLPTNQDQEMRRRADEERARREAERALQNPILRYPPSPPDKRSPPAVSSGELLRHAVELEMAGKGREAVKVYVRAAREGSGKAALRLSQIYEKGITGVVPDYAESLKWEHVARLLGEDVPAKKSP